MPIAGPPLDKSVDLTRLLSLGLAAKPDDIAIASQATRWTWRALDETSTRLAHNLLDFGLKPGDRIASLMPNRTVQLLFYVACLKAGLIVVPLNYRYMAPEIDHALSVSERLGHWSRIPSVTPMWRPADVHADRFAEAGRHPLRRRQ